MSQQPLQLVLHVETAEGELLSEKYVVPVSDDLALGGDRDTQDFVRRVKSAACAAYVEGVIK